MTVPLQDADVIILSSDEDVPISKEIGAERQSIEVRIRAPGVHVRIDVQVSNAMSSSLFDRASRSWLSHFRHIVKGVHLIPTELNLGYVCRANQPRQVIDSTGGGQQRSTFGRSGTDTSSFQGHVGVNHTARAWPTGPCWGRSPEQSTLSNA